MIAQRALQRKPQEHTHKCFTTRWVTYRFIHRDLYSGQPLGSRCPHEDSADYICFADVSDDGIPPYATLIASEEQYLFSDYQPSFTVLKINHYVADTNLAQMDPQHAQSPVADKAKPVFYWYNHVQIDRSRLVYQDPQLEELLTQ